MHFNFTVISRLVLRCRVVGKENVPRNSSCIIVANHVNLLDSPLLGISLGRKVYFMAKEEVFDSPLIGYLAKQFGAFPVGKGKLDRRAGRKAVELLSQGEALIILPEGTRSKDGKLGPAYHGAALLAVKRGVPIVPVGITGTRHLTGKWWFLKRHRITINIGQPFTLTTASDKLNKEETRRLTDAVMKHIAELLPEEYRGRYG